VRRAAILSLLVLAAAAPPASAQRLPSTTTPGVTATRGAGGVMTIRFAATRAGRAAYAGFAGRRLTVRCQHAGPEPVGAGPLDVVTARVRFPARRSSVRLTVRGTTNLCSLGAFPSGVMVATDATARGFLADLDLGRQMATAGLYVGALGPSAAARRVNGVVLSSASATPPRGRIGIFKSGTTTAVVAIGHDGRRVFSEQDGAVARSNGTTAFDQLVPAPAPVTLPTGPLGGAVAALPASSEPGLTATRHGGRVALSFTGTARRNLAGARVSFFCAVASQLSGSGGGFDATFRQATGPRSGPLRLTLARRFDLCTLTYSGRTAAVALDAAARPVLEDGLVSAAIDRVVHSAGADALGGGYPSGALLADRFGGAVVALADPADAPPDRRVGVWSDGARRLVVRAVARTGHELFFEVDGDVVTSNAEDILRTAVLFV
jgi:hypothetical protein